MCQTPFTEVCVFLIILNQVGVGMELHVGVLTPRVAFSSHAPYRETDLSIPFLPPWNTCKKRSYHEYVLHVTSGDKKKKKKKKRLTTMILKQEKIYKDNRGIH